MPTQSSILVSTCRKIIDVLKEIEKIQNVGSEDIINSIGTAKQVFRSKVGM